MVFAELLLHSVCPRQTGRDTIGIRNQALIFSLEKYENVASICKFDNQRQKPIYLNWILSYIVTRGVFTCSYRWFSFLLQEAGHKRADFQMLMISQSLISALNSPVILKSLERSTHTFTKFTYAIWCINGSK